MNQQEDSRITVAVVHHRMRRGGGSEQVVYDVIRGLDPKRFRPVLICLHELGELGETLKQQGVKTYDHVAGHSLDPRNVLRTARILKDEKADMLYVTDGFHNMVAGRLAAMLARTRESVLIFHSYDTIIRRGSKPLRMAMLRLSDIILHPRFTRIIALSESHKEYLNTVKRIPNEKIWVIYNGIDSERYASNTDTTLARKKFGLPADSQVVGMVAGLRPWKCQDVLIKAAVNVLREAPNTHFAFAGDGSELERLTSLAKELGVESNVHFLGNVSDIPDLLSALDVMALTSDHEAFPLSLLESMAASLPMVATDVGSVAEIVEDGVNGYLIPAGGVDECSQAVLRLVKDPELARRLGANGRKTLEEKFTLERMVTRCENLFTQWCHKPDSSTPTSSKGLERSVSSAL